MVNPNPLVLMLNMKEKPPDLSSDPRNLEEHERRRLRAAETSGRKHALKLDQFRRGEQAERIALAKMFNPGDQVEDMDGRRGIVVEPGIVDKQKGNVLVRFGRMEPVTCNPTVLKNLSKKEGGE